MAQTEHFNPDLTRNGFVPLFPEQATDARGKSALPLTFEQVLEVAGRLQSGLPPHVHQDAAVAVRRALEHLPRTGAGRRRSQSVPDRGGRLPAGRRRTHHQRPGSATIEGLSGTGAGTKAQLLSRAVPCWSGHEL